MEKELSLKNKEILELKCQLLEKTQNFNISKEIAKNEQNLENELKILKKKYKKAKIKIKEAKNRILTENEEMARKFEEKEIQVNELRRDLREVMKENLSKKTHIDEKSSFLNEISEKNKKIQEMDVFLKERENLIKEQEKNLDEKNKEIKKLEQKNKEKITEISNLMNKKCRFEEFEKLEKIIDDLKMIKTENSEDFPKIYYKFLDFFNKCLDTDRVFLKFQKILSFLENIEKQAEKTANFQNYTNFLENVKDFSQNSENLRKIIFNNQNFQEIIDFYHKSLEDLHISIKKNSTENFHKISLLSTILKKQEDLINELISKNQDLRDKYCKVLSTNEKFEKLQEKCQIYEKKIANYRENLENKTRENALFEREIRAIKTKANEFEMLYQSQKIEYEKYRENMRNKGFDNKKTHEINLPLLRIENTVTNKKKFENNNNNSENLEKIEKNEKTPKKSQKNISFEVVFRYLIAKSKGFNFKMNKYLNIVPKASHEQSQTENLMIFEEFSNFMGNFFKEFAKIYDDVTEIENNVDSLYLENYNLKVLLLQSFRNILGAILKKNKNCQNFQDLENFNNLIKKFKIGYVDSFDEIPVEGGEDCEKRLDFEGFQNLQVQFWKINGLVIKWLEEEIC